MLLPQGLLRHYFYTAAAALRQLSSSSSSSSSHMSHVGGSRQNISTAAAAPAASHRRRRNAAAVDRSLAFARPDRPIKVGIDFGMQSPSWSILIDDAAVAAAAAAAATTKRKRKRDAAPPPTNPTVVAYTYFVAQHANQDHVDARLTSPSTYPTTSPATVHHVRCILPCSVHAMAKMQRNRAIVEALISTIDGHRRQLQLQPHHVQVLIEGYLFHVKTQKSLSKLCEVGGVLKDALTVAGYQFDDSLNPSSVKVHWGGHGQCDKGDMLRAYPHNTAGITCRQLLDTLHLTTTQIRNSLQPGKQPPKPVEDIVDSLAIASMMMPRSTGSRPAVDSPPLSVQLRQQLKAEQAVAAAAAPPPQQ